MFDDDFEAGADAAWRSSATSHPTPGVLTQFSGPFSHNIQSLRLATIPGARYQLEIDLFAFDMRNSQRIGIAIDGRVAFKEPLSNRDEASFTSTIGSSLPLQIVPVLSGAQIEFGRSVRLLGSGFVAVQSTVTVGGTVISRSPEDLTEQIVPNPTRLYAHLAVEGLVQVKTSGGFDDRAGFDFTPDGFVKLVELEASAGRGTPASPGHSANTGQTITLRGAGFTDNTWVQFDAEDDRGTVGTVSQQGVASTDGTRLDVVVPALAKTGVIRVVGDRNEMQERLQIVPALRAIGGIPTTGNKILLEGSGLLKSELSVSIDGQVVPEVMDVTTISTTGLSQQLVDLAVPPDVVQGTITVTTNGGRFTLSPTNQVEVLSTLRTSSDVGGSIAFAQPLSLPSNTQFVVESELGDVDSNRNRDVDLFAIAVKGGARLAIDLQFDGDEGGTAMVEIFNSLGERLLSRGFRGNVIALPETDIYYLSVSSSVFHDPIGGSVSFGETGSYLLTLQNVDPSSHTLDGIDAIARTGLSHRTGIASANNGQLITIRGDELDHDTRIEFSSVNPESGELENVLATPTDVASDGSTLQVQVPAEATSGMVRLEREGTGIFLQVVPTVTGLGSFSGSSPHWIDGSGFPEGQITVHFGNRSLTDVSHFAGGVSVESPGKVLLSRREDVPFGPISVTTPGGTSAPFDVIFTGVESVADSGTPADPTAASANVGQEITLRGSGFDLDTQVAFYESLSELIIVKPEEVLSNTELTVIVPEEAITAEIGVVGDQSNTHALLQIVPIVEGLRLNSVVNETAVFGLGATGRRSSELATYQLGDRTVTGLTTTFGADLFGPVAVTTDGGTSAPFEVQFDRIDSVAFNGSPSDPGKASANPGQVITAYGAGLSEATQAVLHFRLPGGDLRTEIVNPNYSSVDGSKATFEIPGYAGEGKLDFLIPGAAHRPIVQIVPIELPTPSEGDPVLSQIISVADSGTPANASVPSANVTQTLELVGANFTPDVRVIFPIVQLDSLGQRIRAVVPRAVSEDGSRLQVTVPEFAESGEIRVVVPGSGTTNLGFEGSLDSIYRDIRVTFTAPGESATIRFFDGSATSWGLDNVRLVELSTSQAIFEDDFESGGSGTWLQGRTNSSHLETFTEFTGPFRRDSQLITLPTTPGESYELTFDLYAIDTWVDEYDRFLVEVDGQVVFAESFNNGGGTQSYAASSSRNLPLQIVPTLHGTSGQPGVKSFELFGSGFVPDATTITVGGVRSVPEEFVVGISTATTTDAVSGLSLDGPIRVETAGGFSEVAGPEFASPGRVRLDAIEANASVGIPASAGASANTGQRITLKGKNLQGASLQFAAVDEAGWLGTVTRGVTYSQDGTSATVEVPTLARTGSVRLVGDSTEFLLQIVPTLRSVGGDVSPGNEILIEGSGLPQGEVVLTVDGLPALGPANVVTVFDGFLGTPDQQIVTAIVPTGSGGGNITVTTNGGSFSLHPGGVIEEFPHLMPSNDIGDTLDTALAINLSVDARLHISQSIGDSGDARDVDVFRVDAIAGDRLTIKFEAALEFDGSIQGGLFDGEGRWLVAARPSISGFMAPATGPYFVVVSGGSLSGFDLHVPNSGEAGGTGDYRVTIRRVSVGSGSVERIDSTAASGSPRVEGVASAHIGEAIVLHGSDFTIADRVHFTARCCSEIPGLTISVAADGTRLTAIVPKEAVSGAVRLVRDGSGIFLQIVPRIDQVSIKSRRIEVLGGGFAPKRGTQVGTTVVSPSTGSNLILPVQPGRIAITTLGGTSNTPASESTSILALAEFGTPTEATKASANPEQEITLIGKGFDQNTVVVFGKTSIEPERVISDSELTVVVPKTFTTGLVYVPGSAGLFLQIVPLLSYVRAIPLSNETTRFVFAGWGLADAQSTLRIGNRITTDLGPPSRVNEFGMVGVDFDDDGELMGTATVTTDGGTSNAVVVQRVPG